MPCGKPGLLGSSAGWKSESLKLSDESAMIDVSKKLTRTQFQLFQQFTGRSDWLSTKLSDIYSSTISAKSKARDDIYSPLSYNMTRQGRNFTRSSWLDPNQQRGNR